jgi:hypothetical protein
LSETETILREKKRRKNNQYPTIDTRGAEEHEQKPEMDREQAYTSREVTMLVRDRQREILDQYKAQQDLLRAEMAKHSENMFTRRITSQALKMKGDLSNLIKATLADETITAAKGKETERKHRKVLGGLYHSDHETTTEIEIRRGGEQ